MAGVFDPAIFQNESGAVGQRLFQVDADGAVAPTPDTGATYLTPAEMRRYKAYLRNIEKLKRKRFKDEQSREKAITETIERAYRKAQGIEEPLPQLLKPHPSKPRAAAIPTLAAKTIEYLDRLQPQLDSVLSAALTDLFYLHQRALAEREAAIEARLREDEEDFLILMS